MATISKSVTVSDGGAYNIMLNAIPNGSTVTPVNDIQTWLHCADIWNKNYTTLNQVLANAGTLQALIASNNAADYMARSTDWSGNGQGLVPVMTSNTTPSGEVFADGSYGSWYPWKAFNPNETVGWVTAANNPPHIGYKFTSAVQVNRIMFKLMTTNQGKTFGSDLIFQGSNDKSTWTDLKTITVNDIALTTNEQYISIPNTSRFLYYRLTGGWNYSGNGTKLQFYEPEGICSNQNAMSYIGANNYCAKKLLSNAIWCESILGSTYWESIINAKIPVMTSNTAPSGEASASSSYTSDYAPYHAFDGRTNTYGWCPTGGSGDKWLQYKFTKKNIIKKMHFYTDGSAVTITKIQGSNNGNTFTDIPNTGITVPKNKSAEALIPSNNTQYMYYRAHVTNYDLGNWYGMKMQLYARQDV